MLVDRLDLRRDVERLPIFGLGCAGGAGPRPHRPLAKVRPGSLWLFLVVELCGLTFPSADQSKSNVIATTLFGDGAAACGRQRQGLDQGDVRRPYSGVFGIAAIDGAPEAANQRGNLGSDWELAAGAGFHQPDALDADHLRPLGPLASAHVHLGVIDAERLDLDNDVASHGLRLRQIRVHQAVRAAELL